MGNPALTPQESFTYRHYRTWPDPERWELIDGHADAILSALRLAESHPSAIREAVEGAKREERESCAKLLERLVPDRHSYVNGYDAAVAIRARGEEKGK